MSPCHTAIAEQSIADGLSWGVEVIAGRSGGVLLHEVFGDAERDPDRPLVRDSLFDIASVTKVVATASACCVCMDEGLLDPDAPVRDYLPELHPAAGAVRIRDLATHTSGYDNSKPYHSGQPSGEAFRRAVLDAPPAREPGAAFEYSCVNFILLGFAVEAVAGERLDRFCERSLFAPLGMAETHFGPVRAPRHWLAKMLDTDLGEISDGGARMARIPVGNAGLFSTASDLGRFCVMLLRGGMGQGRQVLSRRAVSRMATRLTPDGLRSRGFGWDMGEDLRPERFSPATFYHTGWTGQSVYLDPTQDLFVVVLTNRTGEHRRAMEIRRDIAAAVRAGL